MNASGLRKARASQPRVTPREAYRQMRDHAITALAMRLHREHCERYGVEPYDWNSPALNRAVWLRKAEKKLSNEKK